MDVLRPELTWVNGKCYRVNFVDPSVTRGGGDDFETYGADSYRCEDSECTVDDPCDEFEIETTDGGRFRTSFRVPRVYFPYVIGSKGATRKRLETETKTNIWVPKQGMDGDIVITGSDKKGVAAARRRINLIVMSARQKQPFTHFISIPLTGNSIIEGFTKFREEVLESCRNRGIDASIFQVPEKLHLTIGTLVLADNEERKKAGEVLKECKDIVIDPFLGKRPLKLRMTGVEYMNDDPAEVDVLYGKVRVEGSSEYLLQELADGIVEYFANRGLMQKQYEQVKLHATVMNTLFREDKGGVSETETSKKKQKPRESFDATAVLKIFENFYFGEQLVETLHLSQRYSTAKDGYYQSSASISLTE
ncbi:activating signal cointegrator 1 complex subunit 1 isoform X1 [Schistocerca gregaria]|uniref:activating signal cointegrator 1 complex subunit 1 isoform X1 n=1 Tax=Schistocerca gregaria TaxID=7010 RepID=UPI00211E72EB|nr:activating signal cointegrator 1 complex subunit 1 isoform X1 [Schistocerca gregaria]